MLARYKIWGGLEIGPPIAKPETPVVVVAPVVDAGSRLGLAKKGPGVHAKGPGLAGAQGQGLVPIKGPTKSMPESQSQGQGQGHGAHSNDSTEGPPIDPTIARIDYEYPLSLPPLKTPDELFHVITTNIAQSIVYTWERALRAAKRKELLLQVTYTD